MTSAPTVRVTLRPEDEPKITLLSHELAELARPMFTKLSVLDIHRPEDLITRARFTKLPKFHGIVFAYYALRAPGLRSDLVNANDSEGTIGLRGMVDEQFTLHFLVPPLSPSHSDFRTVLPIAVLRAAKILGAKDPSYMIGSEYLPDTGPTSSESRLLPAPVNPTALWTFKVVWFGTEAANVVEIAAREAARRG